MISSLGHDERGSCVSARSRSGAQLGHDTGSSRIALERHGAASFILLTAAPPSGTGKPIMWEPAIPFGIHEMRPSRSAPAMSLRRDDAPRQKEIRPGGIYSPLRPGTLHRQACCHPRSGSWTANATPAITPSSSTFRKSWVRRSDLNTTWLGRCLTGCTSSSWSWTDADEREIEAPQEDLTKAFRWALGDRYRRR